MNTRNKDSDAICHLTSDEEMEAQIFRNLAAVRKMERKRANEGVLLIQYPDNRTLHQRLRAWLYVRRVQSQPSSQASYFAPSEEPVWQGHWAITKYL